MKLYILKRFYKYNTKVILSLKSGEIIYKGRVFNIPLKTLFCSIYDIEPIINENNEPLIKVIIKEDNNENRF